MFDRFHEREWSKREEIGFKEPEPKKIDLPHHGHVPKYRPEDYEKNKEIKEREMREKKLKE